MTYCVDASVRPSGLKAAAMVERGGGRKGQYVAVQLRSESPSAHDASSLWCVVAGMRAGNDPEEAVPVLLHARAAEAAPPRPREPSRPEGSSSRARTVRHMSCCGGPILLALSRFC